MKQASPWERLSSIATLGTRRAPMPESLAWPDESLVESTRGASAELALLRLAIATRLWDVAGGRAAPVTEAIDKHPPPTVAGNDVSEAAARRLVRMLGGEYRDFIEEWFEHASAARKTLPTHWLPLAFEHVAPSVRDRYASVFGPAAAWLAQHHPEWTFASVVLEPSEQRWQEGTLEDRRAELVALRRHDPSRAIAWLQSTWDTDPADTREAFLHVLQTGLSMSDEPFLDGVLDDRRKGVRQAAIELLARLPESRHAQRARERIASLVTFEQPRGLLSKLRNPKLVIELPASIDKAAQRDGVDVKPPANRKIGERSFWFAQMLAFVPLQHWTQRFDVDASTFVSAAMSTEYAQDMLSALSEAAVRHPTREWLNALGDAWLDSKQEPPLVAQAIARLIAAAEMSERGALLASLGRRLAAKDENAFLYLLNSIDVAWNAQVTAIAIDYIARRAHQERQTWSHARNTLDAWGRRCDVAMATSLLPPIIAATGDESPWRNALEQLNDIVEFRAAMARELS